LVLGHDTPASVSTLSHRDVPPVRDPATDRNGKTVFSFDTHTRKTNEMVLAIIAAGGGGGGGVYRMMGHAMSRMGTVAAVGERS
jgi:hypothetical protein